MCLLNSSFCILNSCLITYTPLTPLFSVRPLPEKEARSFCFLRGSSGCCPLPREAFAKNGQNCVTRSRIFLLLRRLLAGEEKNEPLFHSVLGGLQFLKTHHGPDMVAGIEIVLVLRILHLLGYLAPREEFNGSLWRHTIWEESVIHGTLPLRALAVSEINHSLQQSQL